MARPRSPNVLGRLQAAALRVFARQGLKHTRMSDIAKEMGVAQGSLYNYVEGKEALFFWLVDRGLDPGETQDLGALPVRAPKPEGDDIRDGGSDTIVTAVSRSIRQPRSVIGADG